MPLPAGKRFFDQYSVICVFGSVVGCVVVPLLTQSVETIIFSAILLSLTARTLSSRATQTDNTNKEERRRNRDATHAAHKMKKKKPVAHQPFVSAEERERQRLEDLRKQEEIRRAEKEKKMEEKKEKKAKRREERMKKKTEEQKDKPNEMSYLGCKIGHNGEYTYTPPATINEISRGYTSVSVHSHRSTAGGHTRNHSDSLRLSTSRRSGSGSSKSRGHLNASTRTTSDPLLFNTPLTEALAFNPQPPLPPSSPKTKAWQGPAAPPTGLPTYQSCWQPPSRSGSGSSKRSSGSANRKKIYSAPNSVNQGETYDFLSKSRSLESISHSKENLVWSSGDIHPPSPTSTPDSPGASSTSTPDSPKGDSYYSLFGTSGNISPFGADLLSTSVNHWE